MATPTHDKYGLPYCFKARWSRELKGDDDGFPVPAIAASVRYNVSNMLSLAVCAGSEGFTRSFYNQLATWWSTHSHLSHSTPSSPDTPRWIDHNVIFAYYTFHPHLYTDPSYREPQEVYLYDLVPSFRTYGETYSIENLRYRNNRVSYFTYVDDVVTREVTVPVLEVTLDADPSHPKEKHEPSAELTIAEQVLAVQADLNRDGSVTTEEVQQIDTNQDKVITPAEVAAAQTAASVPPVDNNAVTHFFETGELVVPPKVTVPANVTPPTPQEVVTDPRYRPEESFQVNFLAIMLDQLNTDPDIDVGAFIIRVLGLFSVNLQYLTFEVLSAAVNMIWERLKGNGQLRLTKDTYVGTDKPFTEEEFARLEEAIADRESVLEGQIALCNHLDATIANVDTSHHLSLLSHHPTVQSFDQRLRHVENTYVRL